MTTICGDIDIPCPTCGLKPTPIDKKCGKPRASRSTPRNAKTPSESKTEERAIDVTNATRAEDDDVLTDRKTFNIHVKIVKTALRKRDEAWAEALVRQIGVVGLCVETRKTIAEVKMAGNVLIPAHVVARVIDVFRLAKRGSKSTARSQTFRKKPK